MIVPSGKIISGESSLETNRQLDMSMGLFSVLYNSSHSSVAPACVPAQAISFITTVPNFFTVDNFGLGVGVGVADGFGVGVGVFDGDEIGDTMVTLVTGVFITNG